MSKKAPASSVRLYRPGDLEQLLNLGWQLNEFIFRGVGNSRWGFKTSLERSAEQYGFPLHSLPLREKRVLQLFRRAAHLHADGQALPDKEDWFEWMSLLQHHGGPTRLLDFSESFYCALFFAIDSVGPKDDCAVWAIDESRPHVGTRRLLGLEDFGASFVEGQDELRSSLNRLVGKDVGVPRGVTSFWPERFNQRLAAQQGLFLAALRVDVPFEIQLLEALGVERSDFDAALGSSASQVERTPDLKELAELRVAKIEIEPGFQSVLRRELRRMNLTNANLFPGLDGYSRHLRWELGSHQHGITEFVPRGVGTAEDLRKAMKVPISALRKIAGTPRVRIKAEKVEASEVESVKRSAKSRQGRRRGR